MLAVTGTDGKTTTTLLAGRHARGRRRARRGRRQHRHAAGDGRSTSTSTPSSSSARASGWRGREQFRGDAAAWLNLAPDHLNWHTVMASYEAAKARIFCQQRPDDVAIGFADDPVVMRHLAEAPARLRTFARAAPTTTSPGRARRVLAGPPGALGRRRRPAPGAAPRPHERPGRRRPGARGRTRRRRRRGGRAGPFVGPPHRIELVGDADGVRWFNDSKATTPHAASVADPGVRPRRAHRRRSEQGPRPARRWPPTPARMRAVVAIGAGGRRRRRRRSPASAPIVAATSMADAVDRAAGARPARRRRAAVAGVRQLRLVPRRRLPGPRRRLPPARRTSDRQADHDHRSQTFAHDDWIGAPDSSPP